MAGRYKAYPEYKDSGVEWLQEIPSNWNVERTKRMFFLKRSLVGSKSSNYQLLSLTLKGIIPRDISSGEGKIPESFDTYQKVDENDLVFCLFDIDETPRTIGISPLNGMITGAYNVYGCFDSCYPTYAYYYFYHIDTFKGLKPFYTGLRKVVRTETFSNIEMPCPSMEEQKKIANFLDRETAKVDTLITKQEKLVELLKEKRQAVISHAVTKGLNPDVPMKDSGVEWLGEVPEHWVVLKLKHLIQSLESGCSVNAADTPAKTGEIGVLKTSCVYTRRFRVEENKTVLQEDLPRVKCPIRKGAIIISRMNTPELVGASALVNVDIDNIYLPDRLWQTNFNKSFDIEAEFLAYFMTVEGFRNQISLSAEGASSSMQNIAKEDYLAINAILPQLKEQIEIVNYIKKNEAKFLRLEAQVMNTIELLKERKTALISAAVTGKIDVRDWQPKGIQ
ncbi:restriction endonuclease subunit S [Providencia zhijiangensis]|uniref:Restriction endonuclease subunit S n=1 Tax=Providencia zhijiangensis TaxID=3053982 RepID=A0ABZ0N083_9GAMM|nr:restriction endonuclease subunit S [Providencia sp. D4759]WPA91160.1 restriction endonuclease subunit S [Providencia sp. D4759]